MAGIANDEAERTDAEWELGPLSSGKLTRWSSSAFEAVVPEDVRGEATDVWQYMRTFCDAQWEAAMAVAVENRQRREAEAEAEAEAAAEAAVEATDEGGFFGWLRGVQEEAAAQAAPAKKGSSAADAAAATATDRSPSRPFLRISTTTSKAGRADGGAAATDQGAVDAETIAAPGGPPSVAAVLYGDQVSEADQAAHRAAAEWSFEGPQPWRRALTSLVFTFALIDACWSRWRD